MKGGFKKKKRHELLLERGDENEEGK